MLYQRAPYCYTIKEQLHIFVTIHITTLQETEKSDLLQPSLIIKLLFNNQSVEISVGTILCKLCN